MPVPWTGSISRRTRQNTQQNALPFLPEDIFFHILIWLPAGFLHYCGRYVCKAWAKIIRSPYFIREHLLRSKVGLFIQKYAKPCNVHFLELQGDFEVTPLNWYFPGQMVSSCGGLSLFRSTQPRRFLYVGNPVTRQYKSLPFPIGTNELYHACHIVLVPHTGEYKVVCHCVSWSGAHRWIVLTVGNNMSWRNLDTSALTINGFDNVERTSASVGGVLYWSQGRDGINAIDLRDETAHSVRVPNEFVENSYWLFKMGNRLSCVVLSHQEEILVCVLEDFHSSEWDKVYRIREAIDRQRFLSMTFLPIGWLENGQVFVYLIHENSINWKKKYVVAYNVKTGKTVTYSKIYAQFIEIHTNSLVSW